VLLVLLLISTLPVVEEAEMGVRPLQAIRIAGRQGVGLDLNGRGGHNNASRPLIRTVAVIPEPLGMDPSRLHGLHVHAGIVHQERAILGHFRLTDLVLGNHYQFLNVGWVELELQTLVLALSVVLVEVLGWTSLVFY